jgi:L-alanine-DL-glutamate epimerase-like enolase superfamily enzyme
LKRRAFFGALAAAVGAPGLARGSCSAVLDCAYSPQSSAAPVVKIARVDLFPVIFPTAGYFKFLELPGGGSGRPAVIIKITADDGTAGWGESLPLPKWSYETWETTVAVLKNSYIPALLGRDPSDIDGANAALDRAVAPGFSTGMPISRAGLDIALHDLAGKLARKPLSELWGKRPGGSLTLSWTVNVTKLDEIGPIVEAGKNRGYRNFNIKVGPDPAFDEAHARAVRSLVPEGFLWADANGGYEPDSALVAAPRLAAAGVDVLESPLRPNRIAGYQALKRQGALPILMDEGVVSTVELDEFARLGMMDGVAMKPARCGGLLSCRRQIELCASRGLLWLGSGLTDPDISLAASLVLYSAYGLSRPAALNGPQFLAFDVLKKPLRIANGTADVPAGPGLGIEVDEGKVVDLMKRSGGEKLK